MEVFIIVNSSVAVSFILWVVPLMLKLHLLHVILSFVVDHMAARFILFMFISCGWVSVSWPSRMFFVSSWALFKPVICSVVLHIVQVSRKWLWACLHDSIFLLLFFVEVFFDRL